MRRQILAALSFSFLSTGSVAAPEAGPTSVEPAPRAGTQGDVPGYHRIPSKIQMDCLSGTGALFDVVDNFLRPPPIRTKTLEGPVLVAERVGYLGMNRPKYSERMNRIFGPGNWEFRHKVGNTLVTRDEALQLYEDSYYAYFLKNPKVAEDLAKRAKDVYDTSPSNTASGFDYDAQETTSQHLQDIAVRRAIARLGLKFTGTELLQIRGKDSPLYHLNPGRVPFVRPEMINAKPRIFEASWIEPSSVEDFWQNNKFLVIRHDKEKIDKLEKETIDALVSAKGDQYRIMERRVLTLLLAGRHPESLAGKAQVYFVRARQKQTLEDLAVDWVSTLDATGLAYDSRETVLAVVSLLRQCPTVEHLVGSVAQVSDPKLRGILAMAAIMIDAPTTGQDWMIARLAHDDAAVKALAADPALLEIARNYGFAKLPNKANLSSTEQANARNVFQIFAPPHE